MRDCFWGSAAVKSLRRNPGDDAGNQERRSRDRLFVVVDGEWRLPSGQPLLSRTPLIGTLRWLIGQIINGPVSGGGGQVTHHSRTARGLADTGQVVRRTAPF